MISGEIALYLFTLAAFTGHEIISRVPVILHTPLMSGSNFVHGIVLVGAMIVASIETVWGGPPSPYRHKQVQTHDLPFEKGAEIGRFLLGSTVIVVFEHGRIRLGDDLVPDYATRVEPGAFYGWPYAYLAPNRLDPRRMSGGRSERPDLAARTATPDVLLEAHAAALGLAFYTGTAFPASYRGGLFVAMHGSWNRSSAHGYKVVFLPMNGSRLDGVFADFLTGFVLDPDGPTTWGRQVSLLVRPDGSLLLSEDGNGRIYRISYRG